MCVCSMYSVGGCSVCGVCVVWFMCVYNVWYGMCLWSMVCMCGVVCVYGGMEYVCVYVVCSMVWGVWCIGGSM